eukprot:Mrub_02073.p1 GENE.Mrub_02073~~Mrub_02073.p1  ORF type:complete len:605 (-),score=135.53 Mrub_02073:42-1610(-)
MKINNQENNYIQDSDKYDNMLSELEKLKNDAIKDNESVNEEKSQNLNIENHQNIQLDKENINFSECNTNYSNKINNELQKSYDKISLNSDLKNNELTKDLDPNKRYENKNYNEIDFDHVNLTDQYSNSNSNNNTLNFSSNYNSISQNEKLESNSNQNSKNNLINDPCNLAKKSVKNTENNNDPINQNISDDNKTNQSLKNNNSDQNETYSKQNNLIELFSPAKVSKSKKFNDDYNKYIPKINEINQNNIDNSPILDGIPKGYVNITDMCITGILTEDILKYKKLMSPTGKTMEYCTMTRYKNFLGEVSYKLRLSEGQIFIMGAKKSSFATSGYYSLSMYQDIFNKNKGYMGKLRSNFTGDRFTMYGVGESPKDSNDSRFWREELGAIFYEFLMSNKKSPRQMKVFLPKIQNNCRYVVKPKEVEQGIGMAYEKNQRESYIVLKNKDPKWNEMMNAYVLNFKGRVNEPSIKNFQLIQEFDQNEEVCLQFGKDSENSYHLDFRYPFSPFQAFNVALTCFGWKLYE